MSGHNKWSKVKHRKEATDAHKSKVFGKLAQLIAVESRLAKGDAGAPSLAAIIAKARAVNMPQENIERAIKRGAGGEEAALEAVTYEAYGPGGAALIIEAVTDNKNRAVAEIKHALSEHGGSLAAPGSALWAFKKTDTGWEPTTPLSLDEKTQIALAALVEALEESDEVQAVYTNANFRA
ncbi:MAG: YebC/PmpR family DNA-binding transcriptional regulator [bacterium]|nr:YebC/PmpR family DNA-binding transcriptional regulator [bacterium]MDZ4284964.1 YebC/PmpR family DNA-binding transcriptional regulator [Patescibacteria group bacterium]